MGKQNSKFLGLEGSQIVLVGAVLYVVSWFVPVYSGQQLFGTLPGIAKAFGASGQGGLMALDAPDWLPGWGACKFAWHLLINAEPLPSDDGWKQRLAGSSCLTNVAMVLGLLLLVARRRRLLVGLVLLGCVFVNFSWIWLVDQDPFEIYRLGYFLWLGSFAVVGIGAIAQAGRGS